MNGLSFPSRGGSQQGTQAGHPTRANPCRCDGGPVILKGDDRCSSCGRYPAATIARTFADRAKQLARIAEGRRMRQARKRARP